MNSDEATVAVIDALQTLEIPYLLVGSLASNLYGIPRSTKDADFSVQVGAGGCRGHEAAVGVVDDQRHVVAVADQAVLASVGPVPDCVPFVGPCEPS